MLDAYEHTRERHYVPSVSDRPTVLGYVERLPFKDKSFDFIIASHVLEHSRNPSTFLAELMRVGKAGYIEVPDAFMERINPYLDHRLEITVRKGRLMIKKKSSWCVDPELHDLYHACHANRVISEITIPKYPFEFHVRYYWSERIEYEVVNEHEDASWPSPTSNSVTATGRSVSGMIKGVVLRLIRSTFSQRHRNRRLNIYELLSCPTCLSAELVRSDERVVCGVCGEQYEINNNIPRLFPRNI